MVIQFHRNLIEEIQFSLAKRSVFVLTFSLVSKWRVLQINKCACISHKQLVNNNNDVSVSTGNIRSLGECILKQPSILNDNCEWKNTWLEWMFWSSLLTWGWPLKKLNNNIFSAATNTLSSCILLTVYHQCCHMYLKGKINIFFVKWCLTYAKYELFKDKCLYSSKIL